MLLRSVRIWVFNRFFRIYPIGLAKFSCAASSQYGFYAEAFASNHPGRQYLR
jgi:hypothetical protein